MATIEVRGYASKVQSKTAKSGGVRTEFRLGEKQKEKAFGDRPERITWGNYSVTDFKGTEVPEKAYVTVKGRLKVREYELEGQTRTSLDIYADEIEVAPPLDGASSGSPPSKAGKPAVVDKDPWE